MTMNKFGLGNWMSPWGIVRAAGILAVALFLVSTNSARAQTLWFETNAFDHVWSDATSWTNDLATTAAPTVGGSQDYTISFSDTNATFNSTNDLGTAANGGFRLNQLTFAQGVPTLMGSNLVFTTSSGGALPVVTKSSSATATLTMGATLTTNTTFTGAGLNILVMGGLVSGPGGIIMNGTYTLGLATATNTYSGDTIINSGLFQARAENAFPFGPGKGNVTVNSGGTLSLNNVNATVNGLSGSGSVDKLGTNTRTLNIGTNDVTSTFSGNFLVNGGAGTFLNINKVGAGAFTFAGTNLSSGEVRVNGGQLIVAYSGALTNNRVSPVGSASMAFSNSTIFYCAYLGPAGNASANPATGGVGLTNTAGQAVTLYVGTSNAGTLSTYSGQISGSGTLAKVGPSWQRMQGTNAIYSGDTLINEGTLDINFAGHSVNGSLLDYGGWLPYGPGKGNVFVGDTAQIWLRAPGSGTGTAIVHNVNGLSGSGLIQGFGTGGTRFLIVGNNNAGSTFSGIIRNTDPATNYGPIALTKVGNGTFTLTGTNGYTGGTTINGGVLAVAGDGVISNSASLSLATGTMLDLSGHTGGGLNLASNQTLRGFGGIKGDLTVDAGAVLAPGTNSALGTLTFSNNLVLSAGAILNYRLGTSSDSAVVGGNLTLDGVLNVADSGGLTNTSYTLFTYGGTLTTNGSPTILTFGDLANSNFTYAINIATAGQVKLVVTCSGCAVADPFTTWQNQYFGCTGCAQAQGSADPDGDGMNNTNEFLAGFVPTNNAAYVHVVSVVKTNTDMKITYLGANGNSTTTPPSTSRTNVLEFTTGAANGSYSNNFVSANVTNILSGGTGVGVVTNMVDPGGATGTSRYYRIRVLVP